MRYQRRTPLLQRLVQIAGVPLAGGGGACLLHLLHAGLSRTSVLFHLMRVPLPAPVAPRVLGVVDFALYGRAYGTLLVDEDTRPAASHARHLFETVHALTATGRSYNSVARELGLNWRTVRKYATASSWQECVRRPRPRVPSLLDRYLEYTSVENSVR